MSIREHLKPGDNDYGYEAHLSGFNQRPVCGPQTW